MAQSKRQMVSRQVNKGYVDLDDITLRDLKADVEAWISEYGEDARLKEYTDGYDDTRSWGIYKLLPETEEEDAARLAVEKQREDWEMKEFQRLSKKYGDAK